jgi:hypothetical protein
MRPFFSDGLDPSDYLPWLRLIGELFTLGDPAGQHVTIDPESGITLANGNITVTISPAGQLDINTTADGLVLPRLTTAERDAIPSPVEGTVIYNTTVQAVQGYYGAGKGWLTV